MNDNPLVIQIASALIAVIVIATCCLLVLHWEGVL